LVAVDEVQDLDSNQEIRLIQQAQCPVIMVGDSNQKINEFRHQVNDTFCLKHDKCYFPVEPTPSDKFPTVEWYSTYRLCPLTVAFVEDITGVRTVSLCKDIGNIYWQTTLASPHTLILCRQNESVVKQAIQYRHKDIRIMSGGRIAGQLKAALTSTSTRGMAGLGKKLAQSGMLSSVLKMLIEKDISIEELQKGGILAVSTVHSIKGITMQNVAVYPDVLEHARAEIGSDHSERNVLLVAVSRHTKSLTLLVPIPLPILQPTGAVKKQKTIDFPKI